MLPKVKFDEAIIRSILIDPPVEVQLKGSGYVVFWTSIMMSGDVDYGFGLTTTSGTTFIVRDRSAFSESFVIPTPPNGWAL